MNSLRLKVQPRSYFIVTSVGLRGLLGQQKLSGNSACRELAWMKQEWLPHRVAAISIFRLFKHLATAVKIGC
jgi:hypothetical protein